MPYAPQHGATNAPSVGVPAAPNAVPGAQVSSRAAKVLGFCVAGAALVVLADYAPQAAIGMTVVIGLGVALTHTSDIRTLSNTFIQATGHPALPGV